MSRVAQLEAWGIDIPLHKPFGIAGGAQEVARNVIARAVLEGGSVGLGEGAPFPAFNGETQEGTLAAIASVGRDLRGLDELPGAARCAIEMAVLDAEARARGEPLFLHGGRSLVTDVTISIGDLAECTGEARTWAARGFSRLKVKIGGAGLDDALARVLAVHEGAPRAELLLDGNAGLTAADAIALVRALEGRGVRPILFEQPTARDDVDGLFEIARATGVRVAADESAASLADVERLARLHERAQQPARAPMAINVKPMKYGFREAIAIHGVATARGLGLMIGGMVEGKMAMSASACFAAALGGFDFVDLDTPLFLAHDPFDGGYAQDGERLDLAPIARGHGCVLRAATGA